MEEIKLTVNGTEITGEKGDTVLEVCEKNGIDIPHLCHHAHLTDVGACRMCLVEIEGQRGYKTSCTIEAADGMVVESETDEIKNLRRSILELLFSERNHYCMFCQTTGDCELQQLAYQCGIDHFSYQPSYPQVKVDSTRDYFVFDENRCILCRRCIRACSEIAGHNVLDVRERGSETRIIADLNEAFEDSSCTSCGTCLQVCPTGALMDRKSANMGELDQCETTKSVCAACSVGCGIEVISRDNLILRINGDWDAEINEGLLCVAGRFEPLFDGKPRVIQPMIKQNGVFSEVDWDEASDLVAEKFKKIGMDNVAGLISPRATNEEARQFVDFLGVENVQAMGKSLASIDLCDGSPADIHSADCVVMFKIDLDEENSVVGSFVKRAIDQNDAKLILIDDGENSFDKHASLRLDLDHLAETHEKVDAAKKLLAHAFSPVIIYGTNASSKEIEKLAAHRGNAKLIGLLPGANSKGLIDLGIDGKANLQKAKAVYVLACDDELVGKFDQDFVVLQTSYLTPEAKNADVILPSAIWAEKDGTFTNIDGLEQEYTKIIDVPDGVLANEESLQRIAKKAKG